MDRSHMLQNLRTARSPLSPADYSFQAYPDQNLSLLLHQANQQNQKLMLLQAQAQVAALLAAQGNGSMAHAQALQMEVMKLQAVQQQQNFQQQLLLQQQLSQQPRRTSEFQPDARAQLRNRMGLPDPVVAPQPQTPTKLNPHAAAFVIGSGRPSLTLKSPETTVISGGTSLGSPVQSTPFSPNPTKSDSSSSWRRNSRAGSVSPPVGTKTRPSPLRFGSPGGSSGSGTGEEGDSTPPSSAGAGSDSQKRMYEGLGIGRPLVGVVGAGRPIAVSAPQPLGVKVEPIRQPVGPPCAVDELGAQNFASRMRKRVVNGAVGALVEARERREAAGQA